MSDESRCARAGFGDRAPQGLAVTDQGDKLSDARLCRHSAAQQALKASHMQLGQQQPECGIEWRLAEIGASSLLRVWGWRFANRFMPTREPWPLRIARLRRFNLCGLGEINATTIALYTIT